LETYHEGVEREREREREREKVIAYKPVIKMAAYREVQIE
jgi:hypothetical protein